MCRLRLPVCLIACLLVVGSACSRPPSARPDATADNELRSTSDTFEDGHQPSGDQDSAATTEIEKLQTTASRKRAGLLADEIALSDQKGNWETEAFHETVKSQLKRLGKYIAERNFAAAADSIAAHHIRCESLRPKNLHNVFEDQDLKAFREVPDADSSSTPGLDRRGFEDSLQQFVAVFEKEPAIAIHFKTFNVQVNKGVAETVSYVDIDGMAARPEGQLNGLQQNMVWNCRWHSSENDEWRLSEIRVSEFEEVYYRRSEQHKLFSDCTASVLGGNACFENQILPSIDHWRLRFEERIGIDSVSLTGLAIADVNGDGLDDVYYCDVGGLPNRLFIQQADGTVRDISADAGVDWLDRSYGAIFIDLDNDADQDLVVSVASSLVVMENDGNGRFKPRTTLKPHPNAQSLTAIDYDGDNQLDIYVASYGNSFETFDDTMTPLPWHDANNGAANTMFRNVGEWKFEDVTAKIGLNQNNRRYSYAASWEDFDNDGDQDLYVPNDFGRNNLYVNEINATGRFRDAAKEFGVEDAASGMSVDWADYDNDGWMDLYVGNMFSSAGNRVANQARFTNRTGQELAKKYRRFARGNTLFRNSPALTPFQDVSLTSNVNMARWAWSSLFCDVNNDGWQDLVVANGHVSGIETQDL